MNPRIYSTRFLDLASQYTCHGNQRILRKKLGLFFLNHRINSIVKFSSQLTSLQSNISNPSILRPKTGLKFKTMEQFSSETHAKEDTVSVSKANFTSVTNVSEADGWLNIGEYSIFAWSISGVESCIIIKSEDMQVVFDMGIAVKESVKVPNVFITHGHIDHIGAVVSHIAKRSLFGMKPARYFVPPHLVHPLKTAIQAFQVMAETGPSAEDVNILPMIEGESAHLNSRYFVKSFPTIHRVASQGYILYKEERKLKQEYKGLEGFEISALHRAGKDIHDVVVTPEIAYTGDTVMDVFLNPPTPHLLRVKLLITEATFLEEHDKRGNSMVDKAKARGHINIVELAQNAHLFDNVGHILLVHFSSKHKAKFICDSIRDKLPSQLRAKVTPATVAAATRPSTYL